MLRYAIFRYHLILYYNMLHCIIVCCVSSVALHCIFNISRFSRGLKAQSLASSSLCFGDGGRVRVQGLGFRGLGSRD